MAVLTDFISGYFTNDLGVDLGTANVRINVDGQGIEVQEPSVVVMDRNSGRIIRVGTEARNMLGRTPGNLVAMQPIKNGVISDHEMTVRLLRELFERVGKKGLLKPKPRVIISVPSTVSEVEERTIVSAVLEAGARRVYLIQAPVAAALGANVDFSTSAGRMVVDVGAGVTDIAVLAENAIVHSQTSSICGNAFDELIIHAVRKKHRLDIPKSTAEEIRVKIGSAVPVDADGVMTITGRDYKLRGPRQVDVTTREFVTVLREGCRQLATEIADVLANVTIEHMKDVAVNGIVLTGGCSQLNGMDQVIRETFADMQIPCTVADDPHLCVAYGCGKSLAWIRRMPEGKQNFAREKERIKKKKNAK